MVTDFLIVGLGYFRIQYSIIVRKIINKKINAGTSAKIK